MKPCPQCGVECDCEHRIFDSLSKVKEVNDAIEKAAMVCIEAQKEYGGVVLLAAAERIRALKGG